MEALRHTMRWPWSLFQDDLMASNSSTANPVSAPPPIPEDAATTLNATHSAASVPTPKFSKVNITHIDADQDDEVWRPFWAFWGNRYTLSSIVAAALINRICHLCRPRRGPAPLAHWKRLMIRLPAIVALTASVSILAFRVLQLWTGQHFPGESSLADWVAAQTDVLYTESTKSRDAVVLWMIYLATCLSILTDSLTRTLEGTQSPPSPFNLSMFAFTLHLHSHESQHTMLHYFLMVIIEVSQLLALSCMNTFKTPFLRRLPITTFFGILQVLHATLTPSHRSPSTLGSSALMDLCMLGIIFTTVALHSLTMLLTEGKVSVPCAVYVLPAITYSHSARLQIDTSRLLFSSSNIPSADADYQQTICNLALACLQSTRLVGLERELITVAIPERTYVEIDEDTGSKLKLGIEDLLSVARPRGFNNEVRTIAPSDRRRADRYEAVFLPSSAKWRAIKRLFLAIVQLIGGLWRAFVARLPSVPLPAWVQNIPRWIRLAWHGQNGERRRQERIDARNAQRQKQRQQEEGLRRAISSSLKDSGGTVRRRPGESHADAAWRFLNDLQNEQTQRDECDADPEEDEGDGEWRYSDAEDEEGEGDDPRSRRLFSQSPTPMPDDRRSRSPSYQEDDLADESMALVRAAREEFDEQTPTPEGITSSRGGPFDHVLMAHIASGDERPLTRSRFRSLMRHSPAASSALPVQEPSFVLHPPSSAGAIESQEQAHLREVILKRRKAVLQLSETGEDEKKLSDRDRMRTCVVCCFEER